MKFMGRYISVDGLVMGVLWGIAIGYLVHILIQQAGTMLTIAASVGQ